MTDEERIARKQAVADQVSDHLQMWLTALIGEQGLPADAVLAGAHGAIVVTMAATMGGPMAAASCRRAADRVKDLPSLAAVTLATMPPAGQA